MHRLHQVQNLKAIAKEEIEEQKRNFSKQTG